MNYPTKKGRLISPLYICYGNSFVYAADQLLFHFHTLRHTYTTNLLSNGAPIPVGKTAGKTDLLVTWLYKLTVDNQYYNLGAVIGIMTFIVLAIVSLITYHNTTSYKDEEGFQ